MDRRTFLTRGAAAAGLLALAGCAPSRGARHSLLRQAPHRTFAPVRVSRDRIIRTLVGLRPYRAPGFVVRAESLDDKVVVHNYGHGGGGITLSWGSSRLAARMAGETGKRRFAVLGAGVMGLTTARLLQDRGYQVTLYARDLPPHTTSNVAGGQWSPASVFSRDEAAFGFQSRYEAAARFSHRYFQSLTGPRYGVRWLDNYVLVGSPEPRDRGGLEDLFPAGEVLGPGEHPFDSPWVRRFQTMLVEPNLLLGAVKQDFLLRGGRLEVREFRDRKEIACLDEPVVVNCTGLGSRRLFADEELIPIKGELVVLLPQPEVDYILQAGGSYMFPRSDGIVLGGSYERGEWCLEPSRGVVERILERNRALFEAMRDP
jgi:D-amino-acid oxidase